MASKIFASVLLAACAWSIAPIHGMIAATAIVISNEGATNLIGYRETIARNGVVSYASGEGSGNAMLPATLNDRLAQDVAAAKPLANLPVSLHCVKSASFGTSTFVAIGGDHSPDLTCPGNAAAHALKDDIEAINSYLHIRSIPRGQGHELPPQNF
jgi:hypothetical protein